MPIEDYQVFEFELDGQDYPNYPGERRKKVFHRGSKGKPSVLILHELPGLAPQTFELGDRIAEQGYNVFIPLLFGKPLNGRNSTIHSLRSAPALWCVRREFVYLQQNVQRPITDWLRALCRDIRQQHQVEKIGAIGMCLTGGFVISLMVDEGVMAAVASEPSMPFYQFTRDPALKEARKAALGVSPEELDVAKKRASDGLVELLGLRFEGDKLCPGERFNTLRREFSEKFESVEIPLSDYQQHGIREKAHAVLTYDFCDEDGHPTKEALNKVLTLLDKQLK